MLDASNHDKVGTTPDAKACNIERNLFSYRMILFLLIGPPLAYLFSLAATDVGSGSIVIYLLRGVAVWIVAYLLYLFLRTTVPLEYELSRLYSYFAFHDFVYWLAAGSAGYFVAKLFSQRHNDQAGFTEIGAFVLGFLLIQPVVDLIEFHRNLDPYLLFILPMLRCALVFAIPAFAALSAEKTLIIRGLLMLCVPLLIFISPLVPFYREQSQILVSLLLSLLVIAGSIAPFIFVRRDAL